MIRILNGKRSGMCMTPFISAPFSFRLSMMDLKGIGVRNTDIAEGKGWSME